MITLLCLISAFLHRPGFHYRGVFRKQREIFILFLHINSTHVHISISMIMKPLRVEHRGLPSIQLLIGEVEQRFQRLSIPGHGTCIQNSGAKSTA